MSLKYTSEGSGPDLSHIEIAASKLAPLVSTAYVGEAALTPAADPTLAPYAPGRGLKVVCTVAGNVDVLYANGSTGTWAVAVGTVVLPISVTGIDTSSTATATYFNLV